MRSKINYSQRCVGQLFYEANIDNYEFEYKKKSTVVNGKVKRLNLCYLQLGVSGDKLKCNPAIQHDKGERRPQAIPRVLITKFRQAIDLPSDYDQNNIERPTSLSLMLSFDKPTEDLPSVPAAIL